MSPTLRIVFAALALGLALSCMPKATDEPAAVAEEVDAPAPDSYIAWHGSDNGTFVLDADDEQVQFRRADGTLVVDGTLVPRFFVLSGFLYHEDERIGQIAYVISLLDTKVTALVDEEGDLIDLYLADGLVQWRSSGLPAPLWSDPAPMSRSSLSSAPATASSFLPEPAETILDEEEPPTTSPVRLWDVIPIGLQEPRLPAGYGPDGDWTPVTTPGGMEPKER
jgi:hypothetical protein